MNFACPLCETPGAELFFQNTAREFHRCRHCQLTFVPATQHVSPAAAAARYRTHQNDPADPGYRGFLNRLVQQLVPKLTAGAVGLDYGSGPGPTLSVMLAEQGFPMKIYDPCFAPDEPAVSATYDFVTCTETVEHFAQPGEEFARFDRLLRPGGWLGVMTQLLEDDAAFPGWWYHRDLTHIAFYRPATMRWIAVRYGWGIEFPAANIILFQQRAVAISRAETTCRSNGRRRP